MRAYCFAFQQNRDTSPFVENVQLLCNSGVEELGPEHHCTNYTSLFLAGMHWREGSGNIDAVIETLRPTIKRCFDNFNQNGKEGHGAQMHLAMILISVGQGDKAVDLFAFLLRGLTISCEEALCKEPTDIRGFAICMFCFRRLCYACSESKSAFCCQDGHTWWK
jgi:hypothetical protein